MYGVAIRRVALTTSDITDALCCIRCSPCHVVFHSVVRARNYSSNRRLGRDWSLHGDNIQVTSTLMTTRVGLDTV